jgi:hypothetical protein
MTDIEICQRKMLYAFSTLEHGAEEGHAKKNKGRGRRAG